MVDGVADRLDVARDRHAETIDFNAEDPVEAVRELTGGIGVDRVIDAVGVDAAVARLGVPVRLSRPLVARRTKQGRVSEGEVL